MQAAFYTSQGSTKDVLQLGVQIVPIPGVGEVRVRLRASGINPSDVKSRAGLLGRAIAFPLIIPHSDGAGEIDAVGPGVSTQRIAERVWIWNGQWQRPSGTAAEYIVVPAEQAVLLPAQTDYAAGACLGIPASTAYHAVSLANVQPGQTVLIAGGAGAVGHYAIQIAKARNWRVITTVSSTAKAIHARQAGADEVIDYKTEDVGTRVKELTGGTGVDAIIELDVAANAHLIPVTLKRHGTVVVYGYSAASAALPLQWLLQNSINVRFFLCYDMSAEQRIATTTGLNELLQKNALTHTIAHQFLLEDIVAAHEAVESGAAIGNIVIKL